MHDNCCLDPDELNLQVTASNPTNNATLGAVILDPLNVISPTDITVTGTVTVSELTSCPAKVEIQATTDDCSGNTVDTATQNGNAVVLVEDTIPPVVSSSVATSSLWPPNHDLVSIGFASFATDGCDANVTDSLITAVWSDEPEEGPHAPDAADVSSDLRLRRERAGSGDGRVYLMITHATDACGNTSFACSVVDVPHSNGKKAQASIAQQVAEAQGFCNGNGGAPPPGFVQVGLSPASGPKQ